VIPVSDPSRLLEDEILAILEAEGPIPFARFMDLSLYHPRYGYYTRGVGGGGGRDYVTSSGLHRVFGALVARQAEEMWRLLGRPAPFRFVEFGPGEGLFARDFLEAAAGNREFATAVRYELVERSPALRERQKRLLAAESIPAGWPSLEDLEEEATFTGCVFMNEVLDAFPVHRVVGTDEGPREVHVDASHGGLREVLLPLSDGNVGRFLETAGLRLEVGQEVDLNLAAPPFLARALRLLSPGYAVVIDYGCEAGPLYGPERGRGTLRALHRHRMSEDYLLRPGEQDLTAHVDFTSLRAAAEGAGARCLGLTTQARFLIALGAIGWAQELEPLATEDPEIRVRRLEEREAIKDLVLPDRMGEKFRCLVLGVGGAPGHLTGLSDPWTSPWAVAASGAAARTG
jgi:SAM-dependent MidA family methyltransferase